MDTDHPEFLASTSVTYCRMPPTSAMTMEAWPHPPQPGMADCQITSPFSLLRATRAASSPPGVQISLLPSTSGPSLKPQPALRPLKSLWISFFQTMSPVAALRQAKRPSDSKKLSAPSPSWVNVWKSSER